MPALRDLHKDLKCPVWLGPTKMSVKARQPVLGERRHICRVMVGSCRVLYDEFDAHPRREDWHDPVQNLDQVQRPRQVQGW